MCVYTYICKNLEQEGKGDKYLIHVYLGSFTGVSQEWFYKIGPGQWKYLVSTDCFLTAEFVAVNLMLKNPQIAIFSH